MDSIANSGGAILYAPADYDHQLLDLSNRRLGAILQKFVNYSTRVAFVLPPDLAVSQSCQDLIREHQSHPFIRFMASQADALSWLQTKQ